ncbi:MAG TPA: hypothetical protein DCY13_16120 [Verrucomicrobiales bacterium]|nr:hypothetical protein [Verrucomicrobiales bacterium]
MAMGVSRRNESRNRNRVFVHLKPKAKTAPVDSSKWSGKSQRLAEIQGAPRDYEDIPYSCWRCGQRAVFSAAEQKQAFEVRKAYIWQRRNLCPDCWRERLQIERGIAACQSKWRDQKRALKQDSEFLRIWLRLLEEHPAYGSRTNRAGINMLRRLLKLLVKQ